MIGSHTTYPTVNYNKIWAFFRTIEHNPGVLQISGHADWAVAGFPVKRNRHKPRNNLYSAKLPKQA